MKQARIHLIAFAREILVTEMQLASVASARRQGIREIAQLLAGLQAHQDRADDFQVFTFPVVQEIRRLLVQLAPIDQEGNAREILRQVRDSLLNGGWQEYRRPDVRQEVAALLERHVGEVEEVVPASVQRMFDRLLELKLRPVPVLPGLFSGLGSSDEADDEQQEASLPG